MKVYVVLAVSRPADVAAALAQHFPSDHLELRDGEWLVAAFMTTRDVCERLGVSDGRNGDAVVVAVDDYWGRAPSSIWDWVGKRQAVLNV